MLNFSSKCIICSWEFFCMLLVIQLCLHHTYGESEGFHHEFICQDTHLLKLQCLVKKHVTQIKLYNNTKSETTLAWLDRKGAFSNTTVEHRVYAKGLISEHESELAIIINGCGSREPQTFKCGVLIVENGQEKKTNWTVNLNGTVPTKPSPTPQPSGSPSEDQAGPFRNTPDGGKNFSMIALATTLGIIVAILVVAVALLVCRSWGQCQRTGYDYGGYSQAGTAASQISLGREREIAYSVRNGPGFDSSRINLTEKPSLPNSKPPRTPAYQDGQASRSGSLSVPYMKPVDAISQESSECRDQQEPSGGHYRAPSKTSCSPLYASVSETSSIFNKEGNKRTEASLNTVQLSFV